MEDTTESALVLKNRVVIGALQERDNLIPVDLTVEGIYSDVAGMLGDFSLAHGYDLLVYDEDWDLGDEIQQLMDRYPNIEEQELTRLLALKYLAKWSQDYIDQIINGLTTEEN